MTMDTRPLRDRILADLEESLTLAFEADPGDFEWARVPDTATFELAEFDDEGHIIHIHYVAVIINTTPEEPTA
jgi:hypothetical protein